MADLRKQKDKAAELAAKGKVEKAAEVYREVLDADPKDVGIRQKLAEVLRRSGQVPEAVARYAEVAERFAKDGLLIKAIAICKTILELDPQHGGTLVMLADLYGKRAAADGTRPPPRTMMGLRAVTPPPAPAAEPSQALTIERGVSLPLAPPPPVVPPAPPPAPEDEAPPPEIVPVEEALAEDVPLSFDEPAPPPDPFAAELPPPRVAVIHPAVPADLPPVALPPETAFSLIMSAAEEAVVAGVEDRIHVDPDLDEDAGPSAGDEPVGAEAGVEIEVAVPELPAEAIQPIDAEPLAEAGPEAASPAPRPQPAPRPAPRAAATPDARLPRVPLFSDLGRDAFLALTQGLVLHRYTAGEVVIREGEIGAGFYVVAVGRLSVSKRDEAGEVVVLAHLGDGDFFGEMALLSGAPRAATVTTEGPAEVLELPASLLQAVAGKYPHVAASLRRFYRQRLLANAMAVSPIFRPFGRSERKAIVERFRSREVVAGEVIIREGERSDGLYVILDGAVDVRKRKEGQEVMVGQLREGDLFGEVSCLRKTSATATVVARRAGTLLRLPRPDFDALVMAYPQILELVSTLSDERLENLDAILSGHAEYTEDGLVLI
jgi:CRP-like cAMP-binding protein